MFWRVGILAKQFKLTSSQGEYRRTIKYPNITRYMLHITEHSERKMNENESRERENSALSTLRMLVDERQNRKPTEKLSPVHLQMSSRQHCAGQEWRKRKIRTRLFSHPTLSINVVHNNNNVTTTWTQRFWYISVSHILQKTAKWLVFIINWCGCRFHATDSHICIFARSFFVARKC
jgi:hypothetical protein